MTQDYKEKYPIGSKWETRDGKIAIVVEYEDNGTHPILIYTAGDLWGILSNGFSGTGEFDIDLIKPWVEKRTIKKELLLVESQSMGLHIYQNEMDIESGDKILARKTITITEGEGLDD